MSNLGSTQDLGSTSSLNNTARATAPPRFTAGWRPFPNEGGALLVHVVDMIDSASRIESQNHENLAMISTDSDMLPSLNETLLEIEEHREKIENVLKDDATTVTRHLLALAEAIYDVFNFLDKLFEVKFLFFSKGKNKQKLKTLIQNVRLRSNQIMTFVSLELTVSRRKLERTIQIENDDSLCAQAHTYFYGFGMNSRNYIMAYEKFSELAERGLPDLTNIAISSPNDLFFGFFQVIRRVCTLFQAFTRMAP